MANITGAEKVIVIALIAAVPFIVGLLIGRWWALLLSVVVPVAIGLATEPEQWPLMLLYAPPAALLLWLGIVVAKLRRYRDRSRLRQGAGELGEDRQVGV